MKHPSSKQTSNTLTFDEIKAARIRWLQHAQAGFQQEFQLLRANKALGGQSQLVKLSPIIDKDNLLRKPVTHTCPSNVLAMVIAFPSNIYATVHPIAQTDMMRICDFVQRVAYPLAHRILTTRNKTDDPSLLLIAAKRPPVEETASFLQSLIASHGPNYLEKLFGSKARDALSPLGGVEKVAIALSESQTIEDFGAALHLMRSDLEHLRSVFMAVENGDLGMLKSLGIKDSELGDVKFFLEKLVNTGFLD
ncbi:hypothetical protein KR067_010710 [Drosophila pandora]|nr:hypothetical protein KR067_010710 [Drosophila pandora]